MQICRIILLLMAIFILQPVAYATEAPLPVQMTAMIYQPPTPLIADNNYYLVYEIYLTSYMNSPATLTRFDVTDQKNHFGPSREQLIKSIHSLDSESPLTFEPGEAKVIYMWLAFKKLSDLPAQLIHHLTVRSEFQHKTYEFPLDLHPIILERTAPIVINAPLRGKHWLAANGPSNTSDHRRAHLYFAGSPDYPQRYAIDFIQLGSDGKSSTGNPQKNSSYHCYHQDILAVGDGEVVETQDGIPENIPNSNKLAVPLTEKTLPGNYIILKLAEGKYAGYGHLIPGSLQVKKGDRVIRGQVIAKLGNSGNSSEPHLHFQVIDGPSFLASNGIPYAFDYFTVQPSKLLNPSHDAAFQLKMLKTPEIKFANQLVLENTLMNFE